MLKRIPFQYRITFWYIVFGALWISFSDKIVLQFTLDPYTIQRISTYKGWFYVLTTGIVLFLFIQNEIRRRSEINNQLVIAKKNAEKANNLKTAFLSNLSHYIRTPMNSILGFIELLQEKDLEEENQELFLTYINEQSHHLLYTLNNIIEVSKIQEGHIKIEKKPININDLLTALSKTALFEIHQKNKEIHFNLSKSLIEGEDIIDSDSNKITQILSCLISNAITFTDKGTIHLSYSIKEDMITFEVQDTGRGISKEKQEQLFKNYFDNQSATRDIGEGAGLSLYLSAALAKLLDGQLWLEHSDEQGSLFCLRIPRKNNIIS